MATQGCPCGYLGDPSGRCRCTAEQVARYRSRISGPLLDRIDIHVEVPRLPPERLTAAAAMEGSAEAAARVAQARERAIARTGKPNGALTTAEVERYCTLDAAGRRLLEQAMHRLGLSARAYHRILKVARTIADLAGTEAVAAMHLGEALGYRRLDRGAPQG